MYKVAWAKPCMGHMFLHTMRVALERGTHAQCQEECLNMGPPPACCCTEFRNQQAYFRSHFCWNCVCENST